jgi:aminoglycoside phosphotransferase (APT) family kinase protein
VAHWQALARETLPRADNLGADAEDVLRYLSDEAPAPFRGSPRLVHNDLYLEHVLIDPRSGSVCGVIDWSDAVIGDPALDFAVLCNARREIHMERVLQHYERGDDTSLARRARYLAACMAVRNVVQGEALGHHELADMGRTTLRATMTER